MERRLCQAVGGRTQQRQLDTMEGLGAAWSTGASQQASSPGRDAVLTPCPLPGLWSDLDPHQENPAREFSSEQNPAEGKTLGFK